MNISFENQLIIYIGAIILISLINIAYFIINKRKTPLVSDSIALQVRNKNNLKQFLLLTLNFFAFSLCLAGIQRLLQTPIYMISTYPPLNGVLSSYTQPISFELSTPIDFDRLKTHTNPEKNGKWFFKRILPWLPYGRIITFMPDSSYPPGERIMMYLSDITKPFQKKFGGEYLFEFNTISLPQIVKTNPIHGNLDVPIDTSIIYDLSLPNGMWSSWSFVIEPKTPFVIDSTVDKQITLHFTDRLHQGSAYTVQAYTSPVIFNTSTHKILDVGKPSLQNTLTISTVKPPLISSFTPTGDGILTNTPILIAFDNPMATNSDTFISINPKVNGVFEWSQNYQSLKFSPVEWPKNTHMQVTFNKGMKTLLGGINESTIEYSFDTIGEILIKNSNPSTNDKNIPTDTDIRLTFNQNVDHKSAEKNFSITPNINGAFTWENQILVFKPITHLSFNTKYHVVLNSGVKSIAGLDLVNPYTVDFTTAPEEFTIDVPYYSQNEDFTCNIAAARMLLAYKNIIKTEVELKTEIGSDGTRGNGNPHKGYTDSYGTYWEPISKMISHYRPNIVKEKYTLPELLTEVLKGNPVMIWGQNGWSDPHELSWTNPDGSYIYAINGMHSSVIYGFRGARDNPSEILVNDPWRGKIALPTAEFLRRWKFFNTALVIY